MRLVRWKKLRNAVLLPCFAMLLACDSPRSSSKGSGESGNAAPGGAQARVVFDSQDFEALLTRLADGWNNGDARTAAECFTEDAVYIEPPDKQEYVGRPALYEFFGGDSGRAGAMSMTWHHVVFDAESQIGAGEFTFRYGSAVHGVAMIQVRDGQISRWREYWYASDLEWNEFVGPSLFQ